MALSIFVKNTKVCRQSLRLQSISTIEEVKVFQHFPLVSRCTRTGPVASYKRLGMTQLHLPTVDHFEPSVADLAATVRFIQRHKAQGSKVYVHCRAGHGRSAAGVFAWLLAQDPTSDPQRLNEYFCTLRNVRKTLWKQPNIRRFHANLKEDAAAQDEAQEGDDE